MKGQFEKQIAEMSWEDEDYVEGRLVSVVRMKEMVDEARKEFVETDSYDEEKDELHKIVDRGRKPTRDETILILQYFLRKKNEWFEKWFGSEGVKRE